jgi:WD repeat-containing protein 6
MQHEGHHVPVTALAFAAHDILLAAEGNYLRAYNTTSKRLVAEAKIFDAQSIHGILLDDEDSTGLVWGGPLARHVTIEYSNDKLSLSLSGHITPNDWILDAAFARMESSTTRTAAVVTAHSALWLVCSAECHASSKQSSLPTKLERVVSGSNCILYSAHIKWLSASTCLIASGTAFGDIIIWSVTIADDSTRLFAQSQTHYTFSAHQGSIFGVQISSMLTLPDYDGERRILASCSDDRNVKLWDITDLSQTSSTLSQIQQDTGFGARDRTTGITPQCLATAMGHVSRIWHVQFVVNSSTSMLASLLSFGEDTSMIRWRVIPNPADTGLPLMLEIENSVSSHSGKNIWAVAIAKSGLIATGGADGAIALQLQNQGDEAVGVPRTLLNAPEVRDNFRAYSFIDSDLLLATTDHGWIVLLNALDQPKTQAKIVSEALQSLRGYSLVTSCDGAAFVSGNDGTVYFNDHPTNSFEQIAKLGRKTAGLFSCTITHCSIALLVSSVGSRTLEILFLRRTTEGMSIFKQQRFNVPAAFVVTSFVHGNIGAASYVAVGSRNGSIALFGLGAADNSQGQTLQCSNESAHGQESVTALRWVTRPTDDDKICHSIFSTGRDGTFAIRQLISGDDGIRLLLIHQLGLPFGPNVEDFQITSGGSIVAWGFRSKHFVVYDISAQRTLMSVECGGAHRNWTFKLTDNGGTFIWTKASKLFGKFQTSLPYELINSGGHGREIKSIAVSTPASMQLIATGAEDTDIKLYKLFDGRLKCLQTLRKHNTGIQHLQWSDDGHYLFSSGGFEEFFVWKVSHSVPYLDVGIVCESEHPSSGTSDLRIMGFDIYGDSSTGFAIIMAYSDSTVKMWSYTDFTWTHIGSADYLTACLTHVMRMDEQQQFFTAATDGHLIQWLQDSKHPERIQWVKRHAIHQSAIHATASLVLPDQSRFIATGGDDNAIALTRIGNHIKTLTIPRAHAAAVTGLAIFYLVADGFLLASAGLDQRVKLWKVELNVKGVEDISCHLLQDVSTAVADVSGLGICKLVDGDDALGLLICGVGMDVWRLPASLGDSKNLRGPSEASDDV